MSIFKRPELEKDNPVAPQIYVGPRRKRALARMTRSMPGHISAMEEALQTLVEAAEAFAYSLPPTQESDRERHALMEAISHAQAFLPIEISPPTRPRPASRSERP